MEPSSNGHQDNHQAGQGAGPLPALPGNEDQLANGGRNGNISAPEVMALVSEVTRTSAEIYELIADLAGLLAESAQGDLPARQAQFRQFLAPLLEIVGSTQRSEIRVQLLRSKLSNTDAPLFDAFLEDCWAALMTFKDAGKSLANIIGSDASISPTVTVAETLIQTMKRLDTCSEKVSELPGRGMAVSYQCLAKTAIDLQHIASRLSGETTGK